jgi:hypothetical protein
MPTGFAKASSAHAMLKFVLTNLIKRRKSSMKSRNVMATLVVVLIGASLGNPSFAQQQQQQQRTGSGSGTRDGGDANGTKVSCDWDDHDRTQLYVDAIRAVSHIPIVDLAGTLDDAEIDDSARELNFLKVLSDMMNDRFGCKVDRIQRVLSLECRDGVCPSTRVVHISEFLWENGYRVR